jgi:hypothetical protein
MTCSSSFFRVLCALVAATSSLFLAAAVASQDVDIELFYGGAWHAAPTYARDGIALGRGAAGEGQESPPSSAALTIDNRDGTYNPRNPASVLYGQAGRNTPLRVSVGGSVRSVTEAASWRPQRSIDGGDAWTAVDGGGLLRRLQQGTTPLRSPAVRGVLAESPIAFWPLEDGQGSTQAASGLLGGTPLALTGTAAFGQGDGLIGSPKLIDMAKTTGQLIAEVDGSGTGWGVEFGFRCPAEESNEATVANFMRIRTSGTAAIWDFFANEDMNAFPQRENESTIGGVAGTGANGLVFDGQWHHGRLDVEDDGGGGTDATWYLDGVNMGTLNFAGVTPGHVTKVTLNYTNYFADPGTDPNYVDAPVLGYLAIYDGTTPTATTDAALGYPGELAGERFLRLGVEEGVNTVVDGDETDTQAMGPQPSDTLVNLLRECARTDDALMYEARDELAIVMRPNRDRYNQAAALSLSFIAGQLAGNLQPVLDDRAARNDVTVQRLSGSTARATQEVGPLNVQNPVDDPDGIGRIDTQVNVNTETDDVLLGHATWHLHKGTVDEPRYPEITVDLDAATSLVSTVNAVEIGDRITIANLPSDWATETASLLVIGIKESIGTHRRLVTFTTVPASPYEIAIVGDGAAGATDLRGQAIDTDNATLDGAHNSTTTSLSVAMSAGSWTTDSDDWDTGQNGGGLFVIVGGEVARVTNITGASSPYTLTVVRSVNGVVKSHSSGAVVHVRYPAVVGL